MGDNKRRMLNGELYRDNDPELVAERKRCQQLLDRYNAAGAADDLVRDEILAELLGSLGDGSWIMPRFQCDYGYQITIGTNSFLNYDAILLDCARITIGNDVSIGPRAQLLTALHPIDDHQARRDRWESAAPITIEEQRLARGRSHCLRGSNNWAQQRDRGWQRRHPRYRPLHPCRREPLPPDPGPERALTYGPTRSQWRTAGRGECVGIFARSKVRRRIRDGVQASSTSQAAFSDYTSISRDRSLGQRSRTSRSKRDP